MIGRFEFLQLEMIRHIVWITGWSIVGLIAAIMLPVSVTGYRRLLREEAGLIVPTKTVPLEESVLSYKHLVYSFLRYGIMILMTFLWMVCVQIMSIFWVTSNGIDPFSAGGCGLQGCGLQGWELFLQSVGMQFMLVGLLCLLMFYMLHRNFLAMAKNEESFAATPAIVNQNTPFCERVFIEWLISFGFFVTAGLIFCVAVAGIGISWIPRSPVSLCEALVLLLAITFGAAVINVRLPILRWFVNLVVIGLLFTLVFLHAMFLQELQFKGWNYLPFQDFFDSPQSYPVLFGLMILDAVIVFATITALILGVLYLRLKGTNRFFSQRTVKMIFGIEIVAILAVSVFLYIPARIPCLTDILVCRYRDDWTSHHNTKMMTLASEIIRSTSETDYDFGWAHGIRAAMNLRERRYDEAIADYDIAIRLCPGDTHVSNVYIAYYCNDRGEAKFAKGDLAGALEDFDKAISLRSDWNMPDFNYNRGFVHEKLGNIEAALADYDTYLAYAKRFLDKPSVVSTVPRTGYDDESRRMIHKGHRFGYVISFEELVEIRDRLERKTRKEQKPE
jgi:tetratricopeptide (TPR) repeat protein